MAPIPPDDMGDLWPAAEPGADASDLGSARLEVTGPFQVRSHQTIPLTYTVGRFGLDDTGAIRVSFRWVNDCGPLQTDDPAALNYVTAWASNGVPLSLYVEPYGYRPWSLALRITVTGGFMREGDTIRIVFGDVSGGSYGFRMQTISEDAFEFRVSVDACATGHFSPLDERLHVPVIAGPLQCWRLVAPGLRRPLEPFSLGIRAEDVWGNPVILPEEDLHITPDAPVDGLPMRITIGPGQRSARLDGLRVHQEGTVHVELSDTSGTRLARSEPIPIRRGPHAGYWGDLHGQSGETVGIGTIGEYLQFARDIAFLDVSGHQANDFQITNSFWQTINRTTAEMNEDGRFIVFPGYEWSGNTPVGGDHNVFFRHEDRPIRRSSHAMLSDRSDLDTDARTLDALFDAVRSEDCVIWSHIGGRPADVSFAHDMTLKTAVEVHSNWGTFEWVLTDSLALGHRVGVVSNSDGHKGRPGAGPPGATEFGAYGGLTCFLASELTRDALFEAMRRRHHYGTSGSRICLDVQAEFPSGADLYPSDPDSAGSSPIRVAKAMMGDIVRAPDESVRLAVSIRSPAPIERVDVLDGASLVQTSRPYALADLGRRVRVYWQGAEYRGRGRNTHWTGEISASGVQIEEMVPVNQWNPERPLILTDDGRVTFDAVTSGNFAGVDLRLDHGDGLLKICTNHVEGVANISDLGLEDLVLDAGGLERQIRIRRLPDELNTASLDEHFQIPLSPVIEHAFWVRVTTLDGHLAWSSPIYVKRNAPL
ncbi:MAG: DUF3604 domain-containing protein [Pseudomonadota bacterium]